MKSVRNKFLGAYILVILAVFAVLSAIAFHYVHLSIEYHSSQALRATALQKTMELNKIFGDVERVTKVCADYIRSEVDNLPDEWKTKNASDNPAFQSYLDNLGTALLRIITPAEEAKTFAFSFNPEVFGTRACRYYLNTFYGKFLDVNFNLAAWPRDDYPHTAWFYRPQDVREPLWFGPYNNYNLEEFYDTIAYSIPMYDQKGTFLAIATIEIGVEVLRSIIDNLDYEVAFGFLVDKSGKLLYHKDFPNGLSQDDFLYTSETKSLRKFFTSKYVNNGQNYEYQWKGVSHRLILNRLDNNMLLALSVPEEELLSLQSQMMSRLGFTFLIFLVVIIFTANHLATIIIRPLREISLTASRIARGELNAPLTFEADNELGILANSIRKISVELKEYISYIRNQAYSDAMTGIRNKAAYLDKVKELSRRIDENMATFSISVYDLNGLKRMNDTHGHEFGDMLIQDTASILKSVYDENQIYRTGGDEFVIIEDNNDEKSVREHFDLFDSQLTIFNQENTRYDYELAISKGSAVFNPETDKDYKTVFARADEAMYHCKAEYYRTHKDQRRER